MSFVVKHPYQFNAELPEKVAYFCMEFGIDQALKTYAGGLGFLAGSYMKSAFQLKTCTIGIGILWKYGYYNQTRKQDQSMDVRFEEKRYGFLKDTGIRFSIKINRHDVKVAAWYCEPLLFKTAPLFFLSTDVPENDYLAQTISHKLYDANPETAIAAAILLGEGGAKLLEILNWEPDIYHLNESHALPLAFYLYNKWKDPELLKQKLVFTNHTPEAAGNLVSQISFLDKMGYFCELPPAEVMAIATASNNELNHTRCALHLAGKTNAVSEIHRDTLLKIWEEAKESMKIFAITNGQNFDFWQDENSYAAIKESSEAFRKIKSENKKRLFDIVADQCGEIFDEEILTIVFAKRFTGYKRADIFFHDMERFEKLLSQKERPIQLIWAGKPYPMDYNGIGVFDKIVNICKSHSNCAILTGYELTLSKLMKAGADVWLNMPRLTHEASGTSGISAAMNGAINVAIPDGWFPEFAKDKQNSFIVPPCDVTLPDHVQDDLDCASLYQVLETDVMPLYYDYPERWHEIICNSMKAIAPAFDSNRMLIEYHQNMYRKS